MSTGVRRSVGPINSLQDAWRALEGHAQQMQELRDLVTSLNSTIGTLQTTAIIVSDNFARGDNMTTPGFTPTGQQWMAENGVWGIIGGQLSSISGSDPRLLWIDQKITDRYDISIKIGSIVSPDFGFIVNATSAESGGILVDMQPSKISAQLFDNINGVARDFGIYNHTLVVGDIVRVVRSGTTLTIYLNDAPIFIETLTTPELSYLLGTRFYIYNSAVPLILDDFLVKSLARV